MPTPKLEARARRIAAKTGLRATKSRWHRGTIDNYGGFMLVDAYTNIVLSGDRYDLSPADVIEISMELFHFRESQHDPEERTSMSDPNFGENDTRSASASRS